MSIKIGHASIDERGKTKGGAAGDQTSREVCIRSWYNKKWDCVLRPISQDIADKSASIVEKLANSNLVGYDQNQRNTLHTQVKKYGYNVDKYIASGVKTETDCSAFMTLAAIAAGMTQLEYPENGNAPTTSTMRTKFVETGKYKMLTDSKYTMSDDYLKRGDILVKYGSHTVMALTNGQRVSQSSSVKENNSISSSNTKNQNPKFVIGKTYTTCVDLNVRNSAEVGNNKKKLEQLSKDGQKHAYKGSDGYAVLKSGTKITCMEVIAKGSNIWIKTPSGYLAAMYSGKIYIK